MEAATARGATLSAVALAHAALVAWLTLLAPPAPAAVGTAPALTLFPAPAPPASELEPPAPLRLEALAFEEPVAPEVMVASDPAPAAAGCAPQDAIAAAVAASPSARAAIAAAPSGVRSVNGAIVLWNAGWADATGPATPMAPVRAAVEQALGDVDPACLAERVAGPRLVPVPDSAGTTFLVFGSGVWNWGEVVISL